MQRAVYILLFLCLGIAFQNYAQTGSITPANATVCSGNSQDLTFSGNADDVIKWQISGNEGADWEDIPSTTNDVGVYTASPDANKQFRVIHKVTGVNQDTSAIAEITVDPLPVASTSSSGTVTICENGSYELVEGEATAAYGDIEWTENGAGSITAGAATLTPTYTAAAGDTGNAVILTMTVSSNNTCSEDTATATYTVNVDPLPVASTSSSGTVTICENGSYELVEGEATAAYGDIEWTENGAGSITAGATTLTPTYTAAAGDTGNAVILTMTVSSNNTCSEDTATATYTVNVDPLPVASTSGSGTVTICENGSYELVEGEATAAYGDIEWTENGAGSITAGATTLTPTYTAAAGDTGNAVILTMTVSSNNTCSEETATASYTVNVDPLPEATAGGSQTICKKNGSATVSGASYANGTILWTHNGAGSFQKNTETTLTPTYKSTEDDIGNTVVLTMIVTSNNECSEATAEATYTVYVKPSPEAIAGGSQTICVNETATVSDASSANGTILWTHDGSGSLSNERTLIPTYDPADTDAGKTIILTMTVTSDETGCSEETATASYTVTVDPLPEATAGGSQTICVNETATVSDASSANGTILWTHDGSGSLSNERTLIPTYDPADTDAGKTIILTMTVTSDETGCSEETATASYTVTVDPLPEATAGGSQTICVNETATVSDASSANGTILWTHDGSGSLSNERTLIPTYDPADTDAGKTIILTMTVTSDETGCSEETATASYTVTVDPLPEATAGGSQTICVNETATVSDASSANGTILWTHDGSGSLSNERTLIPTYDPADTDAGNTVTLTMTVSSDNTCNGETATATYTVTVDPLPEASAGGEATICVNETATVSGASSSNGTILWTHDGSGSLSNERTLTPTYDPADTDAGNTVTLIMTVSSDNTCNGETATANYAVHINPQPTITVFSEPQCNTDNLKWSVQVKTSSLYHEKVKCNHDYVSVATVDSTIWYIVDINTDDNIILTVTNSLGCSKDISIIFPTCGCPAIAPPLVPNKVTYCSDQPIPTLEAIVVDSATVDWYDAASEGNLLLAGSNTFTPEEQGIYYAETRDTTSACVSYARTKVTLVEHPQPTITISTAAQCAADLKTWSVWLEISTAESVSSTSGVLSYQGNNIWKITGIPSGTAIRVTTESDMGCTNQKDISAPNCGCPEIDAPVIEGDTLVEYCSNETTPALRATVNAGETVDWYASEKDSVALKTGSTSYTPQDTGTYYAETRNTTSGCTSTTRTKVTLVRNPQPQISVSVAAQCSEDIKSWYVTLLVSEGTVSTTAGALSSLGNNEWKIENIPTGTASIVVRSETDKGCWIERTIIAPQCNCPSIDPPISGGDVEYCSNEEIPTLSVSVNTDETVDWYWYDSEDKQYKLLKSGDNRYTPNGPGEYYAETRVKVTGCTSSTRTKVTLVRNPQPQISVSVAAQCSEDIKSWYVTVEVSEGTLSTTAGRLTDIDNNKWKIDNIPTGTAGIVVTVQTNKGCSNQLTIAAPNCDCPTIAAPVSGGDMEYCSNNSIPTLTASVKLGETVDWYSSLSGSGVLKEGSKFFTPAVPGEYYTEARDVISGCTSTTRTKVTLVRNPQPQISVSVAAQCSEDIKSWYVTVLVSEGTVSTTAGRLTDIDNNKWKIDNIPTGTDSIVVTVQTNKGCSNQLTIDAPNCDCPTNIAAPISGGDVEYCSNEEIPTLSVSVNTDETVDWYWYDSEDKQYKLKSGDNRYTPNGPGEYYAETRVKVTGCTSSTRTKVTLVKNEQPQISVSDAAQCAEDLKSWYVTVFVREGTLSTTAGRLTDIDNNKWKIDNIPTGTAGIVVTVQTNEGCSNQLEIDAPNCDCPYIDAPSSTENVKYYCPHDTIPTLKVSVKDGETVDWFSSEDSQTPLLTGNVQFTPLVAGDYYAETREERTGCRSAQRTKISVIKNAIPNVVVDNSSFKCEDSRLKWSVEVEVEPNEDYSFKTNTGDTTSLDNDRWRIDNISVDSNLVITVTNSSSNCYYTHTVLAHNCNCNPNNIAIPKIKVTPDCRFSTIEVTNVDEYDKYIFVTDTAVNDIDTIDNNQYTVKEQGVYWVQGVTNDGCTSYWEDTIVSFKPRVPKFSIIDKPDENPAVLIYPIPDTVTSYVWLSKIDDTNPGKFDTLQYYYISDTAQRKNLSQFGVILTHRQSECKDTVWYGENHQEKSIDFDINGLLTGLNNFNFKVYPNPTKNEVNLEVDVELLLEDRKLVGTIYSPTGSVVNETLLKGKITKINTVGVSPGVYMVVVSNGVDIWKTKKLIITK